MAQVFLNDAYPDVHGGADAIPPLGAAVLSIDYPWVEGNPYLVTMLTSSGVTIEHEIPVATTSPTLDAASIGRMALLGVHIGIIPCCSASRSSRCCAARGRPCGARCWH